MLKRLSNAVSVGIFLINIANLCNNLNFSGNIYINSYLIRSCCYMSTTLGLLNSLLENYFDVLNSIEMAMIFDRNGFLITKKNLPSLRNLFDDAGPSKG